MKYRIAHIVLPSVMLLALLPIPVSLAAQESSPPSARAASPAIDWPNGSNVVNFSPSDYIKAAIELQALGRDQANAALEKRATSEERATTDSDIYSDVDIFVLCRMLFVKKPGGEFRAPWIGTVPLADTNYSDWPLEPITISNGVPFWISQFVAMGGRLPELPSAYLDYCINNCDWNTYHYAPKTQAQIKQALDDLLSSPKLKGRLSEQDKAFFAAQIR